MIDSITGYRKGPKEPLSSIWVNPETGTITIYRGPGTHPVTWEGSFVDALRAEFEAGRNIVTNVDDNGELIGTQSR